MPNPILRRTILIGLGGAGKLILTNVKRLMMDTYGIVPPCVRLLSMDTDAGDVELRSTTSDQTIKLDSREFLYLKVDQPRSFIESSENVNKWFIKPLPAGAIHNGAGAIRQVGRVALTYHFPEFSRRMDLIRTGLMSMTLDNQMATAVEELKSNTDFELANNLEIYICGSLAGGTGSGTFIDVGIILRDMYPQAVISGFFLLDWVYRDKPFATRVGGNTYAALTELDSLQNVAFDDDQALPSFRKKNHSYTVQYGEKVIDVKEPPFSLVHLVDGRNEVGENIGEVKDLCDAVAHTIHLSIGSMGRAMTSVVDNLLPIIHVSPPRIWKGCSARYSSFGVSCLYYPAIEIWRTLSLMRAQTLCNAAFDEAKETGTPGSSISQWSAEIQMDVERFFPIELGIKRPNVINQVCNLTSSEEFSVQDYELADLEFPNMLTYKLENMLAEIGNAAEKKWNESGKLYSDDMKRAIQNKLKSIENNPVLDDQYLNSWVSTALDHLSELADETSREYNDSLESIEESKQYAENLLDMAKKSKYYKFFGGGRKGAAKNWAEKINEFIQLKRKSLQLEREIEFYKMLQDLLTSSKRSARNTQSDILNALDEAKSTLRKLLKEEEMNLAMIKAKPNQTVIGNGSIVVIPETGGISSLNSVTQLPYEDFKGEKDIHKPSDFLEHYRNGRNGLPNLFLDYCKGKLMKLRESGAWEALNVIDNDRHLTKNEPAGNYIKHQFDSLFRQAMPLWSFNKSSLNEVQALQYNHIVNIGTENQDTGQANFDNYVANARIQYRIAGAPAYSSTGDPYRIWMINYAAALPVYLLADHAQKRKKYYEEISPTYHIDPYFEMNAVDIFPLEEMENRILRVLGMAIVPGIDVIQDKKLTKGHEFTCSLPALMAQNFNEPVVWKLFRTMYDDFKSYSKGDPKESLLTIVETGLTEKVQSMPQDALRRCIEQYIEKVENKLNTRNFSRLISARLTYREIFELRYFLNKDGYAMNIERYLSGR